MRRKFPRIDEKWEVQYRTIDASKFVRDPVSSLALNISGGGLCFEVDNEIEEDEMIALELKSDEFESPILALSKVVWCKKKKDKWLVGAEFWWIGWRDNDAQSQIHDYVKVKAEDEEEDDDEEEG